MIPYIRLYESKSQAQKAIDHLWEQDHGLRKGSTAIISAETHAGASERDADVTEPAETGAEPLETAAESAETAAESAETAAEPAETAAEPAEAAAEPAEAAAESGETGAEPVGTGAEPALFAELPLPYRRLITENVQRGRVAVLVKPAFGFGARAKAVLDSCNPVDVEMPEYKAPQPAPLSEFLGIPVLTDTKPRARLIPRPSGTSFGFGLLSTNPAPLSSLLGLKVLSNGPGNSSFGLPLLSKPKSHWTSSFGLPLLSKSQSRWTSSFGLPLLSKSQSRWTRKFRPAAAFQTGSALTICQRSVNLMAGPVVLSAFRARRGSQ